MITKDIISQPLTTEWAVKNPRAYARTVDIKAGRLRREATEKVTLVSYTTYGDSHHIADTVDYTGFYKTSSDRVKRFLVTNGRHFWIAKSSEFMGKYADFTAGWDKDEAESAKNAERRSIRELVRKNAVAQAQVNADSTKESIEQSVKIVLGFDGYLGTTVQVGVHGEWVNEESDTPEYQTELVGDVRIPFNHFMRLMEKFNELQDA